MAAATVARQKTLRDWPHLIREVRMSVLIGDQAEDVVHGGPAGKNPDAVSFQMITPPDAACAFQLHRDTSGDAPGTVEAGTARIRFVPEAGGDLTGAVVVVHFLFYCSASGGIDASNATA